MTDTDALQKIVSGLSNLSGISTNLAFSGLNYLGARALKRLKDKWIRQKIISDTEARLKLYGMSDNQAKYLCKTVEDKDILQRGAMSDVNSLGELVQIEIADAGHMRIEGELLYRSLIESIMSSLSSDSFTGTVNAGIYLSHYPTPFYRETLLQLADALNQPEKLGSSLLASILKDAGQQDAYLVVDANGKLSVGGKYAFTVTGYGNDAPALRDALEKVRNGESVTLDPSEKGSIKFSSGSLILDRILRFDKDATSIYFSPHPNSVIRELSVISKKGEEVGVRATISRQESQKSWKIDFMDRPEFKFNIIMKEDRVNFNIYIDLEISVLSELDRDFLNFIKYSVKPQSKIFDRESGLQILHLGESNGEIEQMQWVAEINLSILDLRRYVINQIENGKFASGLPELNGRDLEIFLDMAKHARGELQGAEQFLKKNFTITKELASALSTNNGRNKLFIEMTNLLVLPDMTPLILVKGIVVNKIIVRRKGKRVARKSLSAMVGESANFELIGLVTDSKLEEYVEHF